MSRAKPWLIVAVFAVAFGLFFLFDLNHLISFETLAQERERLHAWVGDYPVLAPVVMALVYAAITMLSLPAGAVMTLGVGFLLGTVVGSIVVAIGATVGATGLFLLARSAFGERWRPKVERTLKRMDDGFDDNAFQYLLILRLIPLMPFWLVNMVPAFAGVSLRTYVAATFIGILPGTIVYCSVGAGLGAVFARGEMPDASILTDPAIILPLAGLALLATLPVIYRKWRGSQAGKPARPAP